MSEKTKNLSHITAVEKKCGSIMLIPATFFKKGCMTKLSLEGEEV
jgi:hypothetical protein